MKIHWNQVLAALFAGMLAGAGLMARTDRRDWNSERRYQRLLERFSSELKLSPEQKSRVAELLEAKRKRVEALRAETRPRFEELRSATRAEIRRILDPGQQPRFDAMQAEWEERRRKRHGGHP